MFYMIEKIRYSIVCGRNGKSNRNGLSLIHVEARQNQKRVYFPTQVHVEKSCFCKGFVVNHPLADKYNAYLYKFRNEIETLELDMIIQGKCCTLDILKAAFRGKATTKTRLSEFAETVISNSTRCEHTRGIYRTTMKAVENFQPGATLHDVDYDFLVRFQKSQRELGMAHNTIVCRLRNIRAIINEGVRRRLLSADNNPFMQLRIPSMTPRRGFLDYKDLRRLELKKLRGREAHVRDAFLFACYTGLRFSDLCTLRSEHFREGWIIKKMVKTGDSVQIPYKTIFRGKAAEILERYTSVERFARFGSNSDANRTLRRIAEKAKIAHHCTFHLARHTCGTLLLREGVPVTTVQMILGHRKLETTKGYAEVDDLTIEKDVKKAFCTTSRK